MTPQRLWALTPIIAVVSFLLTANGMCLGQDSKPATNTSTQPVGKDSKDVEELRNQNTQLKQELDLLRRAVAGLTQDVQSLRRRSVVAADVHGTVLEYGDIFFAENRKHQTKTILFRNVYKSPPLVLVCESGTAGNWVLVKSECITTYRANIAVQGHFDYPCRIGFLVIGEGRSATEAPPKKTAKTPPPRTPEQTGAELAGRPSKESATTPSAQDVIEYTVLDEQVIDAPAKTELDISILVSGEITEASLRSVLQKVCAAARARRGFRAHEQPTSVLIDAYTSKKHFESRTGLWIAQVHWKDGQDEPSITIKKDQLKKPSRKPERKVGLAEEERKQIYWEAVGAQYRALGEADRKFPLPNPLSKDYSTARVKEQSDRRRNLETRLTGKYRGEVAKKHGLTIKELDAIELEGETNEWPTPPWEYGPPAVEP